MTSGQLRTAVSRHWPVLIVPLLALVLVLPLLLHGPSCGHDFGFHVGNWIEAAAQMRHDELLPHWAYSAAYNAGEPRFMFYPPVSWLLGSLLVLTLPISLLPAAFTFLALTFSGWGMLALARRFTSGGGALLAAAVYLANPYMLFTAYERTAYAELLAAAWMPWLFRAAFAERPRWAPIAIAVTLLWLTNAPAAVMGTYALVLIVQLRLLWHWNAARKSSELHDLRTAQVSLLANATGGLLLGLALASFYLIPAAWERRYVQIAMAIIPNMRIEDNFLFGHTGYGPHDQVLHTASVVALLVVGLSVVALILGILRSQRQDRGASAATHQQRLFVLAAIAVVICLLLWHGTLPLWHVLPEMAFLQFPWRLLAVLACVLGAAVALAVGAARVGALLAIPISLAVVAAGVFFATPPFRQGCEAHELPADRVALFTTHHGVGPTDEYTPTEADNDQLRWDDPAWWLAATPNEPGPNTVPNPASTILDYDQPPPLEQTVSGQAPTRLHLVLNHSQDLILNLRDYPAWVVTVNGQPKPHLQRDDGLLALALQPGPNDIAIHWRRLPDVWLGDGVSLCAVCVLAWFPFQSRRIRVQE